MPLGSFPISFNACIFHFICFSLPTNTWKILSHLNSCLRFWILIYKFLLFFPIINWFIYSKQHHWCIRKKFSYTVCAVRHKCGFNSVMLQDLKTSLVPSFTASSTLTYLHPEPTLVITLDAGGFLILAHSKHPFLYCWSIN